MPGKNAVKAVRSAAAAWKKKNSRGRQFADRRRIVGVLCRPYVLIGEHGISGAEQREADAENDARVEPRHQHGNGDQQRRQYPRVGPQAWERDLRLSRLDCPARLLPRRRLTVARSRFARLGPATWLRVFPRVTEVRIFSSRYHTWLLYIFADTIYCQLFTIIYTGPISILACGHCSVGSCVPPKHCKHAHDIQAQPPSSAPRAHAPDQDAIAKGMIWNLPCLTSFSIFASSPQHNYIFRVVLLVCH